MKLIVLIVAFLGFNSLSGQQKTFAIEWENSKVFETGSGAIEIPYFKTHLNYRDATGIHFFAEWPYNGTVNTNNTTITNVSYEKISPNDLKDLDPKKIPNTLQYTLSNSKARGKRSLYLELSPIIKTNGAYQKVTRFTINYNVSSSFNRSSFSSFNTISNSKLSNGEWYKFYITKTGIYKLDKSFLNTLGINTDNLNPQHLKIYGNGGAMLPYLNALNTVFDPTENAIKVVGEQDAVFNNTDYIVFYGEGPDQFSTESDTNINLYTDKTYYYINISPGNGKRIQQMPLITASADAVYTTFDDYQFIEEDVVNIAKLGRKWFGDDFDVDNQRTYQLEFPDLVPNSIINYKIQVGATAESPSSMAITINNEAPINLNLPTANMETVIASSTFSQGAVPASSETVSIALDYDNGGNPSSNAFLDYITLTAKRQLNFRNTSLFFRNDNLITTPGIAQFNITNAANLSEIWDITDRLNITNRMHTTSENQFNFKTNSGTDKRFVAINLANLLVPQSDVNSRVANQNLKGTIFNNSQGEFQDIDYLILTPTVLKSQADRLAAINKRQYNHNVKVVTLKSIYSEFNTGNPDISAIRNFVKYVYDNASQPENRVKYLCLFGDTSYDYKNRINNNNNLFPSWYSLNSFSLTGSFVSDDFYTMMDTNEGRLLNFERMDIAVGRMLAGSVKQAKEMVDKVEAYYQEEAFGNWRNNVIMVSDDVDVDWERIIQNTTEDIALNIESEKPFFNVVKIHTDAFQQEASSAGDRYPEVNKALKDAIEVGATVVNYFGHGGEDNLAVERIFDAQDAQNVNNICKFNCFVTITCEYTKFDDPNRLTSGEFIFWNKNGGAINLVTTTRQIFVGVGVNLNQRFDDYLFAYGSNDYPTVAEALRLTKIDNSIGGISQKRLVFYIGDPALKLAFPQPNIQLTHVNDVPITQATDTLKALSRTKLTGRVVTANGSPLPNYNGILTATVFDKPIARQTLANDGTTFNGQIIRLDYNTLGEVVFNGQATVTNGNFDVEFVVPRDIGIPVGNGKVSFYAQANLPLRDQTGANFDIQIGGINTNAPEDNVGPVINLFMNDENFVTGGITNNAPTLLAKLYDDNGINTASGIGHDILAILDGDQTNPFILNDYYQANVDDYTNGVVSYPFRDLEPGRHTLTLRAWDVYNNSATAEIEFTVFDQNEGLVINNVLNYPNPFVDYTEFWFNHNSSESLDVSIQIFTVSGKLVKTLNGQTNTSSKASSFLSRDIVWDGRDDFGQKIGKGVYVYKLKVRSATLNKQVEKIEKLVIL